MRIVVAALWLILFLVLFAFAVNNTFATDLHFFAGMTVKAPLIALLLAADAAVATARAGGSGAQALVTTEVMQHVARSARETS
jgi:uncharacterized integral membrane protein